VQQPKEREVQKKNLTGENSTRGVEKSKKKNGAHATAPPNSRDTGGKNKSGLDGGIE